MPTRKSVLVSVLKRDINKGEMSDCRTCPIALAVRRQFPRKGVYVESVQAYVGSRRFDLPPEAKAFIASFDDGDNVQPMRFTMVPA